MWVYGLDWAGPGQVQVTEACECGNEPSGSVKCGEFLDQLQTSQLLKKSAPWSKCRSHTTSSRFGYIVINDCRILNTYNGFKKKPHMVSGAHPKFFSGGAGNPEVVYNLRFISKIMQ